MRPEGPIIRQLGGRAVEQTDQVWDTGRGRKDIPPRAELGTSARPQDGSKQVTAQVGHEYRLD